MSPQTTDLPQATNAQRQVGEILAARQPCAAH